MGNIPQRILDMTGYQFLEDAYTGGGGFLNGNYLTMHPREDIEKATYRREMSYYSNFVRPILDSLVNPIFKKTIARDWQENDKIISLFLDDVDKAGNNMNRFMKKATRMAKLYGSVFIMVDNAKEISPNQAKMFEERQFPYLYIIKPSQVKNYKCDSFGKLLYIQYEVNAVYCKTTGGYKAPAEIDVWEWTEKEWHIERHDGTEERGVNQLGIIPIVPLLGTDSDACDLMPMSPMMSIARTNLAIFNLSSELRELLRNQAFSILCYPVTRDVPIDKVKNGIEVGTNDMLFYDGTASGTPSFIAPNADQANLIQNEINRLITELYRQSNLTSILGEQTRLSGLSKQWDFEQTNQVLGDMAENCELCERMIIKLLSKYLGISITYKIVYPREFGVVDIQGELENVAQALNLNVGAEFNKYAKIKATDAYLSRGISDEQYDSIIEEIMTSNNNVQYNLESQIQVGGKTPSSIVNVVNQKGNTVQNKTDK